MSKILRGVMSKILRGLNVHNYCPQKQAAYYQCKGSMYIRALIVMGMRSCYLQRGSRSTRYMVSEVV